MKISNSKRKKIQFFGSVIVCLGATISFYKYFFGESDNSQMVMGIGFAFMSVIFFLQSRDIIKTG